MERLLLQEREEVPVKDFAEGHNWSHQDETNFIFGRQKHHGYNYNRHTRGESAPWGSPTSSRFDDT
jgi:hypothetical protein